MKNWPRVFGDPNIRSEEDWLRAYGRPAGEGHGGGITPLGRQILARLSDVLPPKRKPAPLTGEGLGGTGREMWTERAPKIRAAVAKVGRFPAYAAEAQEMAKKANGELPSPLIAALARYIVESQKRRR